MYDRSWMLLLDCELDKYYTQIIIISKSNCDVRIEIASFVTIFYHFE